MSYILDALKKVEHEKTRKLYSGGITKISGDLFLETRPRPSRGGARKIAGVIVCVLLVTCAGAWFVVKNNKKGRGASPAAVPIVVSAPPLQPASLPAPLPVTPPQQAQPPATAVPEVPVAIPQTPAAVLDKTEQVATSGKKSAKTSSRVPKTPDPVVQTIPAPAEIKVSGIAWQDEPAMRRAVVNGLLLKEGATISGARILEISQGKVRFSSPAGIFDAILNNTK